MNVIAGTLGTLGTLDTLGTLGAPGTLGTLGAPGTLGTLGAPGTLGTQASSLPFAVISANQLGLEGLRCSRAVRTNQPCIL